MVRAASRDAEVGLHACRRSASFIFVPSFVIAGLDPAIHAEGKPNRNLPISFPSRPSSWTTGSSPVVTKCFCVRKTRALKNAPRERILLFLPREAGKGDHP
jgi:hypothetical protein